MSVTYILVDAGQDKFEYPYRMTYNATFGKECTATLTVRNTGTLRFTFEEALHTYLRVGDVRQVTVSGLGGTEYLDRATGHELGPHRQTGDVRITEETDRIYHSTGDIEVIDPGLGRRITVARTGSQDAVVWNPWVDKARTMQDFGDDEWTGMVCVETANVAEHAITLSPGKEHVMGFALRLAPIEQPAGPSGQAS